MYALVKCHDESGVSNDRVTLNNLSAYISTQMLVIRIQIKLIDAPVHLVATYWTTDCVECEQTEDQVTASIWTILLHLY